MHLVYRSGKSCFLHKPHPAVSRDRGIVKTGNNITGSCTVQCHICSCQFGACCVSGGCIMNIKIKTGRCTTHQHPGNFLYGYCFFCKKQGHINLFRHLHNGHALGLPCEYLFAQYAKFAFKISSHFILLLLP